MTPDQVKGNKLFLVCTACGPEQEFSLEFTRRKSGGYDRVADRKVIEHWFEKHQNCGGTLDHFKLGMEKNPNWDRGIPVSADSSVKGHVRLALVKSNTVKV